MTKRLYKSRTNKVLAGICGGLGEYFAVDPVLIRLLYLFTTILTGVAPGIIVYLIAIFVVPMGPTTTEHKKDPIHVVIHEVKKEEEKKGDDTSAV